ncbi:MAG TPA: L,D-transpeptidase [Solirubrobacteraceae bacterium]|nr:L,D-transpeptidase [Solirubrobacteraceae bacterium]
MNDATEQPEDAARSRPSALKIVAIILATVLPAAAIIAGIVIASESSSSSPSATAKQYTAVATTTTTTPAVPPRPREHLPPGHGTLVALVLHPTTMYTHPGGPAKQRISNRTPFGSSEVVWVVKHSPKWLGVVSADAGNGRIGWIHRSAVSLSRVNYVLKVSLRTHTVSVIRLGRVIHRYDVAIGRPSAPTPTGNFAVTDRLTTGDPTGPYGCCILAISAHAPHTIQGWAGGDRIAIHSTPDTGSIGLPVSHGCLRLTLAQGHWLITHIPLGTPTIIRE